MSLSDLFPGVIPLVDTGTVYTDPNYSETPNQGLTALSDVQAVAQLRAIMPPTWFPDDGDVLNSILATYAEEAKDIETRNAWSYQQDRIKTATGVWLDMYAEEFFGVGGWMYRRNGEGDDNYRKRILFELLAPLATRVGMASMLKFWCGGIDPIIIEPWNPNDTGVWDGNIFWDRTGYFGSQDDPWTVFIQTHRAGQVPFQCWNDETASDFLSLTPGIINNVTVSNTNYLYGGWDAGSFYWIDGLINESQVTDLELYAVINRTKQAGTKAFVNLTDSNQLANDPDTTELNLLNYNFQLNVSKLADTSDIALIQGPPPGFVNTYLDLNFTLNRSYLGVDDVTSSGGIPIPVNVPVVVDSSFTVINPQT